MRRRSHPADLTDLHILVVEDNELNLEIAVFSLEAVQLFEKSKPYGDYEKKSVNKILL